MSNDPTPPKMSDDEKALIAAAVGGDLAKVRELLGNGVPVDARTVDMYPLGPEWDVTPLMCAAAKGHLDIVRALLEAGAEVSAACQGNKADGGSGSTALHHALLRGQAQTAEALLDAGADPNAVGRYARTPLTCAIDAT